MLRRNWTILAAGVFLLPAAMPVSAQISFSTAVDLAVRNSHEIKMATSDVNRALAGLEESRDAYLPSFTLGSSVGYSYGFPVGQPTLFNGSAQSLLLSFSQSDYVRSARAGLLGAQDSLKDTRQKIIAEAALDYLELDTDQQQLDALAQQHTYGERLIAIEQERLAGGFSSAMDLTRAQLTAAQLELRQIHLRGHAEVLKARLGNLTGLPVEDIATESQTLPQPPDFASGQRLLDQARNNNFGIQAADAAAQSKFFVSFGDKRQILHPQVGFGLQYSRYAKFNNYAQYYTRFQHNNFEIGLDIKVPVLDAVARAKARGSAADAVHAQEQANMFRQQLSEQTLELEKSLDELTAQQKVARLQSDLARETLESVTTQLQTSSSSGATLTPKDEELAKIEERQRYTEMLDANFQLIQAQLNLLRSVGGIEDWARSTPQH
ncbi:MAG: TolC family protein [Acidobacteriaceae bacterium]